MPKRILALTALLLLMPVSLAYAGDAAPSSIELIDAPTITVDWSRGTTQIVTLGGNRALTFLNGQGGKYILRLQQDSTGSRTVTWPSSVHWPGTNGPTLTTTAGKADYIVFIDNGVSYDMVAISQGL